MGDALEISDEDAVLRVGHATSPQELASAVAHACYEGNPPVLRAIGAGAVNQAVKALAIASGYTGQRAMFLTVMMGFTTLTMGDNQQVSAMVFRVLINGKS